MTHEEFDLFIPLHKASVHIPGQPHISTLHRWRSHGIRGTKLETYLVGGRRFTTREALQRFFDRVAASAAGAALQAVTVRRRLRQRDAAAERLRARGILKAQD